MSSPMHLCSKQNQFDDISLAKSCRNIVSTKPIRNRSLESHVIRCWRQNYFLNSMSASGYTERNFQTELIPKTVMHHVQSITNHHPRFQGFSAALRCL